MGNKYLDFSGLKRFRDNFEKKMKDTVINSTVADALSIKKDIDGNDIKSDVYESVEKIVDDKMKWLTEFPVNENNK